MFFSTVSGGVQFYRFKEDDSSEVKNKFNKISTILFELYGFNCRAFCYNHSLKNIFEECTQSPFLFLSCTKENYYLQMQELAPIVLFVYNRPWHSKKTVEAINKNMLAEKSELYIFSDGPKNDKDIEGVKKVREFIKGIKGFSKTVIVERGKNLGLANSVINGVTEILQYHDRVIVLEDDLISSLHFLEFINSALIFYADDSKIISITGYGLPINIPSDYKYEYYVLPRASSWGWASWRNRWMDVDWQVKNYQEFNKDKIEQKKFNKGGEDLVPMLKAQIKGEINSWAIRWSYYHFIKKGHCLYPVKSKIQNIGTDSSGTHSSTTNKYNVELDFHKSRFQFPRNLELDNSIVNRVNALVRPSLFRKVINYLKYDLLK